MSPLLVRFSTRFNALLRYPAPYASPPLSHPAPPPRRGGAPPPPPPRSPRPSPSASRSRAHSPATTQYVLSLPFVSTCSEVPARACRVAAPLHLPEEALCRRARAFVAFSSQYCSHVALVVVLPVLPPLQHLLGRLDLQPSTTPWQAQRASSLAYILNREPGIIPLASPPVSPPVSPPTPAEGFRAALRNFKEMMLERAYAVEFAPPLVLRAT